MGMRVFGEKQPYEEYYVAFDFSNVLASASINSATVTAVDSEGANATAAIIDSGQQIIDNVLFHVNVWVKGGVSGITYTITCKTITSSGEKYELDAQLPVMEI
jgi:hypothetical protein